MEKIRKSKKRLKTAKELNRVVAEFYLECHEAKRRGKPRRLDAADERGHRDLLRHGPSARVSGELVARLRRLRAYPGKF